MLTFKDFVAGDLAFEKRQQEELERLKEKAKSLDEGELLDLFYGFIGQYISTFQLIEAKLDELILRCVGHERWHVGQSLVSLLSNRDKIELVHSVVMSSAIPAGNLRQREWAPAFEKIIHRLKDEGDRRNKIVHSTYLFDFMKIGHPPMRSKRKKRKGKVDFDREYFDLVSMSKMIGELMELVFDVGLMKTQLLRWDKDLIRPEPHGK